jgi:hypothetical protein
MYHDHDAFERVSRAMRKPYRPVLRTETLAIPELIGRLDDLFASRAAPRPPMRDLGAPTDGAGSRPPEPRGCGPEDRRP